MPALSKAELVVEAEVKPKSGTTFSATTHIVTAVIGAGVLALPQSLGNLGWVAGPLLIIVFYVISVWSSRCLSSLYEHNGEQHGRYADMVEHMLGPKWRLVCGVIQNTYLFMTAVAYTITAAVSMQAIANLACGNSPESNSNSQQDTDRCFNESWAMTLIFGGVQLFLSQTPSLEEARITSLLAAAASVGYSLIALILSCAKAAPIPASAVTTNARNGTMPSTSVGGIPGTSDADKARRRARDTGARAFNVLNAIGNIAFAFGFSGILLEIEDTIGEPPKAQMTMNAAINIGLGITVFFYLLVAIMGYLALGTLDANAARVTRDGHALPRCWHSLPPLSTHACAPALALPQARPRPETSCGPQWTIGLAHSLVILHMLGSYQAFAQPFFVMMERVAAAWLERREARATNLAMEAAAARAAAKAGEHRAAGAAGLPPADMETQLSVHLSLTVSGSGNYGMHSGPSPYREESVLRTHLPKQPPRQYHRRFGLSVVLRCCFVAVTTAIAAALPFFSSIVGLIGALVFFPLAILFPFAGVIKAKRPSKRTIRWMTVVAAFALLCCAGAVVGSVVNIIQSLQSFTFT
eukprot:scaffold1.g5447.t1